MLLPLRSVRGTLAWAADTLKLDIERAEGIRGTASGTLTWSRVEGVQAQAQFAGLDAATLHSRAVPTAVSGQLAYATGMASSTSAATHAMTAACR